MAVSYDREGWAHNIFVLSVSSVVYAVLLGAGWLFELVTSNGAKDDFYDLRISLQSCADSAMFHAVKRFNATHATDGAFFRIFPSLFVCVFYVYNTYQGAISSAGYAIVAAFALFMLLYNFVQIPVVVRPWRFVFRYDFAVETLSLVSLVLSRGENVLNFSFLQAHIVLTRFMDVLPTLTALFWKKPQPHLEQKIRFVAIFLAHIYIFASGLQLFERLGDPLSVFRSTALELTMWNALYFTFVTVFTVGFGDFIPYTLLGRTWMVLVITIGVLLVSYKISKFHELSTAFWNGQGAFVKQDGIKHCVICGNIKWEYLKAFVEEFYSDHENHEHELVVMSDRVEWTEQEWSKFFDKHTFYKLRVSFFRGSCMTEEDLARAKVKHSMAVFVLNNQHNPNVYVEDSETLKRILTIRSYSPETPIFSMCALTDSMFQIGYALEHPGVNDSDSTARSMLDDDDESDGDGMIVQDYEGPTGPKSEAICMQDLEMSMLAGNVVCNGMSTLLSNLLLLTVPTRDPADDEEPWLKEYKAGTENCFHFIKLPRTMNDTTYRDIALTLYDNGVVLLATKSYFGDEWKPITPDTKLTHSSIGLVITFLARIDLRSLIEKLADKWAAESVVESDSDDFPTVDEMSHRTPSWHEIAGARLIGDGHDVMFFDDDYDELGEYDELEEDLEGDADDEKEHGSDVGPGDSDVLRPPPDIGQMNTILPYPFNYPQPPPPVLPLSRTLTDVALTSANDNVKEISHSTTAITTRMPSLTQSLSDGADDIKPAMCDIAAQLDDDINDDDEEAEQLHRWQSPEPPRSALRQQRTEDDNTLPGNSSRFPSDNNRVAFTEHNTQRLLTPRLEGGTSSKRLRRLSRKTHALGLGPLFGSGGRSVSSQELPRTSRLVSADDDKLDTKLDIDPVSDPRSNLRASLADFCEPSLDDNVADTGAQPEPSGGDVGRVKALASTFEARATPCRERAKTRFQTGENIVYPGQSFTSMDEVGFDKSLGKIDERRNSNNENDDSSNRASVWYGDRPLPSEFKNHVLVCVIGQMGMMNLKQFLLRLRAAQRDTSRGQQVVAICPMVTEENVQELSELYNPKISLIQGNSLSIKTLQSAQYSRASAIIILACEDKSVVNHMDSQAIYTIMTLDHLIEENANLFVCSMIDSEESLHLLRAPQKLRLRFGDLGAIPDYSLFSRRRSSRYSLQKSTHGSYRSSKAITRGYSFFDFPPTTSMSVATAPLTRMASRGIRQSRSFVFAPHTRQDTHRHPSIERFDSIPARIVMEVDDSSDHARHPNYGAAPFLVRMSTATLGKKSWYNGPKTSGSGSNRQDPTNAHHVSKKSRDDAFEKERYASGEMMISSMFIALLIREFSMSGLTEVVGTLFGTRLETQPCWVRSIPVPPSWLETVEDSKPLEYRDLCEKLLENCCIPLGLYRCGAAPVRVFKQHENEDLLSGFPFGRDHGNDEEYTGTAFKGEEYAELHTSSVPHLDDDVQFMDDPFGDVVTEFVQERRPDDLQTPPGGFSSAESEKDDGLLLDSESGERGIYNFVTSDRSVVYMEHENGMNVLPYVYTNPEPYTVVSKHDAIYVLVNPHIDLAHLK